ncbi:MAG: hypothetical protein OEY43_04245 [Gammaproteobacteria bacterium]|nr:hypothetical protein [Gammaproteobacteria bacterium]
MKIRCVFALAALLLVNGCVATKPSDKEVVMPEEGMSKQDIWQRLTGHWYGSLVNANGSQEKWIIERYPQGSYKVTSRIYQQGSTEFEERIGVGHWGISGPVYFTMFRGWIEDEMITPVNSKDADNYNAHKIDSLDGEMFSYHHYVAGAVHTERRVAENSVFPE